jgi:thiosulfate dehydrogenase
MTEKENNSDGGFNSLVAAFKTMFFLLYGMLGVFVFIIGYLLVNQNSSNTTPVASGNSAPAGSGKSASTATEYWQAPDESTIPAGEAGEKIRYGKELVMHTSLYFGPKGKIAKINNGMNCRNCHLNGGTKPFALNFSAVTSTYPKLRHRANKVESTSEKINECFLRSLNGKSIPEESKEMTAIVAYIDWLGKDVKKGEYPKGFAYQHLEYTNRAADPVKGKKVYDNICQSCHGPKGQGVLNAAGDEYQYPPLWGPNSYCNGATIYRLTVIAGFVKANMPYGTSFDNPVLQDTDAWDVAAFISTQERPVIDQKKDWLTLNTKPIDIPFGPYLDPYSATEHKYGPYKPIDDWWKKNVKTTGMKQ